MKRNLFFMLTLFLLAGCGGKQLVWVDVDEMSGADTAVSQPSAPEEDEAQGTTVTAVTEADPDGSLVAEMADDSSSNTMAGMMSDSQMNATTDAIETNPDEGLAQDSEQLSEQAALAVQLMAEIPEVADWLANYPDWSGNAWAEGEDGRFYTVDLYSEAADEWLGWGYVNVADGLVEDYFVPRELSAEEFQIGREKVETFVFGDEEVLARLGNVADWGYDTWYNRWDANWQVWFWYGLEELAVTVGFWEEEPYLESIANPAEFEAEEALENSKNQAIELAWQAEGIDQAVAGVDNWQTYVSQQGDTVWAVTFATEDQELFYALVDIESWTVLESE